MGKLVIPEALYFQVHCHLLKDEAEHLAFFLCNVGRSGGEPIFLAREIILIEDGDLQGPLQFGIDLKLEALLSVINKAVRAKKALVEAHSHPFSNNPAFSPTDEHGFKEFVPYVIDSVRGMPYGATVWGQQGMHGSCWSTWSEKGSAMDVLVVGQSLAKPSHTGRGGARQLDRYDRQVRAFGPAVQRKIAALKIGIVGLGGLGSHVAQQLAYLGVRDFVLVDGQMVETTNLNRLVGATLDDVGHPKVEVVARAIKAIAPKCAVQPVHADLQTELVLDALKLVDAVFGCVDNDGARLVLNELSLAYLTPYIDAGTEIHVSDARVEEAGGRVNLVLPSGPCLHCMGQLELEGVRIALATKEEVEQARRQGYSQGDDEPSPSVVSLNGLVASLAVTEFLNLVAGLRPPSHFTTYDMLGAGRGRNAQWAVPQRAEKATGCFECSLAGMGDAVSLERYLAGASNHAVMPTLSNHER